MYKYIPVFIVLFFIACSTNSTTKTKSQTDNRVGYLVDAGVSGVEYYCDNDYLGLTGEGDNRSGKFIYRYECNYISFRIGEITLADIKTTNINRDDGIVYITDLVGKDRSDTNNTSVKNITRLLQTLDDDNNPENGIFITQEIREKITHRVNHHIGSELINESDLQNILTNNDINKTLVTEVKALVHFEQTLRDNSIQVDTVPPYLPYLTKNILATSNNKTYIEINGEKNTKIYLNGVYTNKTLNNNGIYKEFELNTTAINNNFNEFNITLEDSSNQFSKPLVLKILKDTIEPNFENLNSNNNISTTTSTKNIKTDINVTDNSLDKNLTLKYEILGEDKEFVELDIITTSQNYQIVSLKFKDNPSVGTYEISLKVFDEAEHENDANITITVTN